MDNLRNDSFSALTLLVGRQYIKGIRPVKTELWGAGMVIVICLERGADLHMAELLPLPLTVSCFSEIQICFTFLVPAHLGSHGKRAVKRVCVCVCCGGENQARGQRTFWPCCSTADTLVKAVMSQLPLL